jgi:hypothetical protein
MEKREISPEDEKLMQPLLDQMSARAHFTISLKYLLQKWDEFTSSVEEGYNYSIYDYTNDLSSRDLLEKIIINSSGALNKKLITIIGQIDDRYRESTDICVKPLRSSFWSAEGWWWFRIPKKLIGELKEDFKDQGII